MPLKDQPYIPFYVKDFEGDEKLRECDATSHGVYIRLMCLMHKSKIYGKILLEQKYQQLFQQNKEQNPSTCSDFVGAFVLKFVKHLPFTVLEIEHGLCQLIENEVIHIEGNYLCQKRMVKDGEISDKRASAGRKSASGKGGINNFVGTKHTTSVPTNESTKSQQNTAIAIANEFVIKGNDGIRNTRGVQGGEFEDEDTRPLPDYYMGNWTLDAPIADCLSYYTERDEFQGDRLFALEIFKKQYIELPNDEIYERISAWGKKFNEATHGKIPKRPMRGENSWVQHFHNWLRGKNLSENPIKTANPQRKIKEKTIHDVLRERGQL